MEVLVREISRPAEGIRGLTLVSTTGEALEPFTAGAHIDVSLPSGITRQYSLINDAGEGCYRVCVNLDANSRGGSAWLHETLAEGDTLTISAPRNNFPLVEDAAMSILIAGGIGITPILAMVRRLAALRRPWRLYHCTRTIARTPFAEELRAIAAQGGGEVVHIHDGIPGIRPLDIGAVVAAAPAATHFYCCGPAPLMDAFAAATADVPPANVHVEHFSNAHAAASADGPAFDVVCARSGTRVTVPAGMSILQALEVEGLAPLCSCREGICGTCETTVLDGDPDHRDMVLTPEERESNQTMMICVSRARGGELVLDI